MGRATYKMASEHVPSPPQYEDLDSIQDLLLSFEDDSIITNDSPLARLPRVRSPRAEAGRPAYPAKTPRHPAVLLLQSDTSDPAAQNSGPSRDSTRHVPLCSHDGDDEAYDELSTDARLTFDRSVYKLRYGDDNVETLGTKFSPSKSVLHAADLYVFWYAVFEVLVLGPLLKYAWVCVPVFCVWGGLWWLGRWTERRAYYYR